MSVGTYFGLKEFEYDREGEHISVRDYLQCADKNSVQYVLCVFVHYYQVDISKKNLFTSFHSIIQ